MPQTTEQPLARTLDPSEFPYRFSELVSFSRDFDATVRPGEVVNPKGLDYHTGLDRLLVSLSPFNVDLNTRTQIFNAVTLGGTRTLFAPGYKSFRSVESKIAVVPQNQHTVIAGFTPGQIFLGRGPQTEISHLSAEGTVLEDIFAEFGAGGGFWGGLCFDTEGEFGGRLIAAEANGKIYLLNPFGVSVMLTDLFKRLEGLAIAPPTFGPFAKHLIVGVEGYSDEDPFGGEIYAVDRNGAATLLANIGYAAESLAFVPPMGGTYYQAQLAFDRERENRILSVSSSQFLNRLGRLVVVNEMTGEIWEIGWDGSGYTQQPVGRVPGRWSTSGFHVQGTELEAGCFAIKTPRLPNWRDWEVVPGNMITDRSPAAAADFSGDLVLFSKNMTDREVYTNGFMRKESDSGSSIPPDSVERREWMGWHRDPERLQTPHSLACCTHNNRLYSFAVRTNGLIAHKYHQGDIDEFSLQPWSDVPGGFQTGHAVGSATINGRLVVCALDQSSGICLNELAPGGRYWNGWYEIPGGGRTNAPPAVVSFQDELYVFIKGLTSQRILMKSRTPDGDWSPWAEVPSGGKTDYAISAAATEGQLFVFITGIDNKPYVNVASETGTWSGWNVLPNPGVTDNALAPASVDNRVYIFCKGINDKQLYIRSTL